MRSLMVLLLAGTMLVPAFAQMGLPAGQAGMMGGGRGITMMRGRMMMGPAMMYPLHPMAGHSALDAYFAHKEHLGLSDEQVNSLKSMRAAYKKEAAKTNVKITELQNTLDELYAADELDYEAIEKEVAEMDKVQSKLRAAYFKALDKADKVLTGEQREKILELTGGMMH